MDGYKIGSARIYQLFSNAAGGSSTNSDSSRQTREIQQKSETTTPSSQNTDAVRLTPANQQEQAARAARVEELKQQVKSGEYQKNLKNPATVQQVAKSIVEFYSA